MGYYRCSLGHMLKKTGDKSHEHTFKLEHSHALVTGRCRMHLADGTSQEFTAPALMHVEPGVTHSFEALSDDVSYICMLPMRLQETVKSERNPFGGKK